MMRICWVKWYDAASSTGWNTKEHHLKLLTAEGETQSVGFVLQLNEKGIVLMQSCGFTGKDEVDNVLFIPKSAIIKKKYLT